MKTALTALAALTIAYCLALPAFAADPATAEAPQLHTLKLVSGPVAPFKMAELPRDAAYVAREFPGAVYSLDGGTLVVSVSPDKPAMLATYVFRSDCPDNSQYSSRIEESTAELPKDRIDAALIAWTRWRHDALNAPVRTVAGYAQGEHYPGNVDVRLDLKLSASR